MKKLITLCIAVLLLGSSYSFAQKAKSFDDGNNIKRVYLGDTILIKTDTAYVFSIIEFDSITHSLATFRKLRPKYKQILKTNKVVLRELKSANENIKELILVNDSTSAEVLALRRISDDLSGVAGRMENVNDQFEETNTQTEKVINELKAENKKLKKQIRKVWWDGTTDKIVSGLIGVAVGVGGTLMLVAAL